MFELHIADTNVSSGAVALSWCTDIEQLKKLAEANVLDPQVVISVVPQGGAAMHYEQRQVVPLKDLMAYITFRKPGTNRVFSFIVDSSPREAKARWLARSQGTFDSSIADYCGDDWSYTTNTFNNMRAAPLVVDVPSELFAPEPAAWEKAWVNNLFHEKSVDQCAFRRRRMFAYTVQPVLMLLAVLIRMLPLSISLLFGLRAASFKTLNPVTYDMDDAVQVLNFGKGSYFIRQIDDSESETSVLKWISYVARTYCLLPFMPLSLIILTVLFKTGIWIPFFLLVLGVLLIIGTIAFIATGTFTEIYHAVYDYLSVPKEAWYMKTDQIQYIVCDGKQKARTLQDLPSEKRTLRLHYYNLKSKICKPFAG